jgi:ferredoxin
MNKPIYYRAITRNDINITVTGTKIPKNTEFFIEVDSVSDINKINEKNYYTCHKLGINSIWHDEFKLIDEKPIACHLCKNKCTYNCPKNEYILQKHNKKDCKLLINELNCGKFESYPPRMTEEEFNIAKDKLLEELPKEFRNWASSRSWVDGHAYGYEEVINYLRTYIYELKEPIAEFQKRIGKVAI